MSNGFGNWKNYMEAKVSKLGEQFAKTAAGCQKSKLFNRISICINGLTSPPAQDLKLLFFKHGGICHPYTQPSTTYVIASQLADVKIRKGCSCEALRPQWILDCIEKGHLLDYRPYLLVTNRTVSQPKLAFNKSEDEANVQSIHKSVGLSMPPLAIDDVDLSWFSKPIASNDDLSDIQNEMEKASAMDIENDSDGSSRCSRNSKAEIDGRTSPEVSYAFDFSEEHTNDVADDDVHEIFKRCDASAAILFPDADIPNFPIEMQSARKCDIYQIYANKANPNRSIGKSAIEINKKIFRNADDATTSNSANGNRKLTATDPDFLKVFYNKSRLHHIAALAANLKDYISELREQLLHEQTVFAPVKMDLVTKIHSKEPLDTLNAIKLEMGKPYIMHIDMDCFFVSVALQKFPEHRGSPVIVTHSKGVAMPGNVQVEKATKRELDKDVLAELHQFHGINRKVQAGFRQQLSLSEVACASYEARACGIENGMFVGEALKLCPNLIALPYDFLGYSEVAYILYNTIAKYTLNIEAVSCDELYADVTELILSINCTPLQLMQALRDEIYLLTGCPCSAGIGANKLQARMATKKAKPNGQYYLAKEEVPQFMRNIMVNDLPGVGRSTSCTLKNMGIILCSQLQQLPLEKLQGLIGHKLGKVLKHFAFGNDIRPMRYHQQRKSVSVDVNYGIRFKQDHEVTNFLNQLCTELHSRLITAGRYAKCITLKLMVRAKYAPLQPAKFMGHGACVNSSKSVTLEQFTNDLDVINKNVLELMSQVKIPPNELRGIGIQLTKLNKTKGIFETAIGNPILEMYANRQQQQFTENNCNSTTTMQLSLPLTDKLRQEQQQQQQQQQQETIEKANSNSEEAEAAQTVVDDQDVMAVDNDNVVVAENDRKLIMDSISNYGPYFEKFSWRTGTKRRRVSAFQMLKSETRRRTLERQYNELNDENRLWPDIYMEVFWSLPDYMRNKIIQGSGVEKPKRYHNNIISNQEPHNNQIQHLQNYFKGVCDKFFDNEQSSDVCSNMMSTTSNKLNPAILALSYECLLIGNEEMLQATASISEWNIFRRPNCFDSIIKWVEANHMSSVCDAEIISHFLCELLNANCLTYVYSLLYFIGTIIMNWKGGKENCRWHSIYRRIITIVNTYLKETPHHGKSLVPPVKIVCEHCSRNTPTPTSNSY